MAALASPKKIFLGRRDETFESDYHSTGVASSRANRTRFLRKKLGNSRDDFETGMRSRPKSPVRERQITRDDSDLNTKWEKNVRGALLKFNPWSRKNGNKGWLIRKSNSKSSDTNDDNYSVRGPQSPQRSRSHSDDDNLSTKGGGWRSRAKDYSDDDNVSMKSGQRRRAASLDDDNLSKGGRRWGRAKNFDVDNIASRRRRGGSTDQGSEVPRSIGYAAKKQDSMEDSGHTPQRQLAHFASAPAFAGTHGRTVSFDSVPCSDTLTSRSTDTIIPFENTGERAKYNDARRNGPRRRRFRVRPYHCFPESVYMSEEDIYNESLMPSINFEFLKSYLAPTTNATKKMEIPENIQAMWGSPRTDGRIGALRVEVLGCISLARQKPDVSVYLVCGDSAFCTDVIQGYRSPIWPSASRRAAVFPIHHAYAQLFIGVFDVRVRKNKENDVFIGRVSVDVASIRPDTEYDITFPLRASKFVYDRKKRGVIRLRFSLHWFSERAAITSYFKAVRSRVENCPIVEGQPTIPCADPKTFRNVAVTVHGCDLPGKYSRNAFRATVRELNLYQQNFLQLFKLTIKDAVLYEKPFVSLYLFFAGLHCVMWNTVQFVPPYFVGYILIFFLQNYFYYVESDEFNLGYKPITAVEFLKALFVTAPDQDRAFEPILVRKRTKQRNSKSPRPTQRQYRRMSNDDGEKDPQNGIQLADHREFPFAEAGTYPKLAVEDALAPSARGGSRRGSTTRFHGRLSVYYTTSAPTHLTPSGEDEDDSSIDSDEDNDDETVMTESHLMGDSLYDMDFDGDDDEEDEMPIGAEAAAEYGYGDPETTSQQRKSKQPRVKVGPPQDNDVKSSKVPPQLSLKRIEVKMHKTSRFVSVELVHAPTVNTEPTPSGKATETSECAEDIIAKKKKKVQMDEFDKLLGLQTKSANPVQRIAATFLGPFMRIIRIFIFVVRISFHVSTWRDPYMSFWVLISLCSFLLVLIIFPWRAFFLVSTIVALGPQNILLRKYLEKKANEKETASENNKQTLAAESAKTSTGSVGLASTVKGCSKTRKLLKSVSSEDYLEERPPFRPELHGQVSSSRKVQPRAVAIPYNRLKKDRFYDWPPDPTVSRATPLLLRNDSLHDVPEESSVVSETLTTREKPESAPPGIRRRQFHAEQSAAIPLQY